MRAQGFKGITTNSTYDAWSPSRAYSHYHGGVRILSETASCKIATPITVRPDQLRKGEGYDARRESANFGPMWRGGEWRLRDITNYMTTAAFLLLRHAAENREEWLGRFYEIGKEAVRPRKKGEIYAYKISMSENVSHLVDILDRAGVEYAWLKDAKNKTIVGTRVFNFASSSYPSGTLIVPLAQPYGSFAKAIIERQYYPDLRDSDGHPQSPYDVTAQTLPLLMEVEVKPVFAPFYPDLIRNGQVKHEIGDCELTGRKSIALYRSSMPSIDKGWTDWMLRRSCEEYEEITDLNIRQANFAQKPRQAALGASKYKVIVIPDQPPATILNGYKAGTMPPEYTGGLGHAGVKALREFVEEGGTLVCLNRASDFAIEQF